MSKKDSIDNQLAFLNSFAREREARENNIREGTNRTLNGLQSEESFTQKSEAEKSNDRFVPISSLIEDPRNDIYDADNENAERDIIDLRDSIMAIGLLQKLEVKHHEGSMTKYDIISGHRRAKAIRMLSQEEYERIFPAGVPVTFSKNKGALASAKDTLAFTDSNLTTRTLTPRANRKAYKISLAAIDEILENASDDSGLTETAREALIGRRKRIEEKLKAVESIIERLTPELGSRFEKGEISYSTARRIIKLDKEDQGTIETFLTEGRTDRIGSLIDVSLTLNEAKKSLDSAKAEEQTASENFLKADRERKAAARHLGTEERSQANLSTTAARQEKKAAEQTTKSAEERVRTLTEAKEAIINGTETAEDAFEPRQVYEGFRSEITNDQRVMKDQHEKINGNIVQLNRISKELSSMKTLLSSEEKQKIQKLVRELEGLSQ